MTFESELQIELALTSGDHTFKIPGGQVKRAAVRMASYGFDASVEFWTVLEKRDAPLFTAFQKPDLLTAKLSVKPVTASPHKAPPPIEVQGIVRVRTLAGSRYGGLDGAKRFFRHYSIEFGDAAEVLWRQHRPIELHTEKKMSALLDAHKTQHIALKCDWDALEAARPLLCLGVGTDETGASFYDFVVWFVDTFGGVFTHDATANRYTLAGSKSEKGKAANLDRDSVGALTLVGPRVMRHGAHVLNASSLSPTDAPVDHKALKKQVVAPIRHDVLVKTPIPDEAEGHKGREKRRLGVAENELSVEFKEYPRVDVRPGAFLRAAKGIWSPQIAAASKDWRVIELSLALVAKAGGQHDETQAEKAGFTVDLSARLEQKSDPLSRLPAFRAPRWPVHAEGKVRSPGGDAGDRTWMLAEHKKTSVTTWHVDVPLWNKTVSVPATPHNFPGEWYFPPYKNERVVVALYFDRAELHRYVDWGVGVRMPHDTQGDQILLGKSGKSQTQITHHYLEEKPEWLLKRVSGGDHQTVRMKEGNLLILVKEDPGSAKVTPTFDVTPEVAVAKSDLSASVGGASSKATAACGTATSAVKEKLAGATTEVSAALEGAEAAVAEKVAEVRGQLTGALAGLSGQTAPLATATADAKAALAAAAS